MNESQPKWWEQYTLTGPLVDVDPNGNVITSHPPLRSLWNYLEPVGFIYELVRRLPRTKARRLKSPRDLSQYPPYPELSRGQRQALIRGLWRFWKLRPLAHTLPTNVAEGLGFKDYASPGVQFDLRADWATVSRLFRTWFEEQKRQRGLLKEQTKGRSRNRGVIPFKVDWARIEALETPYSQSRFVRKCRNKFREDAIKLAKRHVAVINRALLEAERAPELPEEIFLANPFLQWGSECIPTRERGVSGAEILYFAPEMI